LVRLVFFVVPAYARLPTTAGETLIMRSAALRGANTMRGVWSDGSKTDEIISKLQDELREARTAIIELMPVPVSKLLTSHGDCRSRRDFAMWRDTVAETLASLPELQITQTFSGAYARCPLCKGKSQWSYSQGFVVPGGLIRHFEGSGNTHQCVVTEAAFKLARTLLQSTFQKSEAEETQRLEERRKTEQLFLIHPDSPPKLLTEIFVLSQPRNLDELKWAEDRLARLGFTTENNGNVRSYKLQSEECAIFADPRESGRIAFFVFKESVPTGRKARRRRFATFKLPDGWKNDLNGKFKRLRAEAHRQLTS
jgi:hypothetical protein